jgi:hypothetical protein
MAQWDISKQPLFKAKEEDNDDNNINMQQDNNGEEAKGV